MSVAEAVSRERVGWFVFLGGATLFASFAIACGVPFAALAGIAAWRLPAKDAFAVSGLCWLLNQLIGFTCLGYPAAWDTFAWGAVLGISVVLATAAALVARGLTRRSGTAVQALSIFGAAYALQQGSVVAASFLLPNSGDGFTAAALLQIFATNAFGFGILYGLVLIAERVGLWTPTSVTGRE